MAIRICFSFLTPPFLQVLTVANSAGNVDELHVDGTSYEPVGAVKTPEGKALSNLSVNNGLIRELSLVCSLCNYARITYDEVSWGRFQG